MKSKVYLFSISSHSRAIHINSLDITFFKPEITFLNYDYLIITSKQAVKSLMQYDVENLKPALCISEQSALAYESIGGKVLERGSGYGDDLTQIINKYPKSVHWLYVRAKIVASDFVKHCKKNNYLIDEAITYSSECSNKIHNTKVEENATLIFTSPSSVKCFLKNNYITSESTVVVIGKTTAKALPENVTYYLAKEKTIESCFDVLEQLE